MFIRNPFRSPATTSERCCACQCKDVTQAELDGHVLADVIRGVLSDLDLTPEQSVRVSEIVPARLRARNQGVTA